MTLSHALLSRQSLATQVLMVLAGSALVALSARISVPMFPVPMTLQTLTISLIGLVYGARLAALTLVAYLVQGAVGLPVFSPTTAPGLAAFAGPTAGFLVGFVGMAWMTGWLAERMNARGILPLFVAALVPALLLFVAGGGWPMIAASAGVPGGWTTLGTAAIWGAFVGPFLLGAVVKSAIAALAVAMGWKAAGRLG